MGSSPGSRSPRPVPAYFCALEVQNVRCFGDVQRLELMDGERPAKWTVLLGDNGVGKTTLLQCLYAMAPFASEIQGVAVGTLPRMLARDWGSFSRGQELAVLSAEVLARRRMTSEDRAPEPKLLRGSIEVGRIGSSAPPYTGQGEDPVLCFCCAYGASRRMGKGELESRSGSAEGISLFSDDVPLINAAEWLLQADYAARSSGGERARVRRDRVKQALVDLLPDVESIREAGLDEDPPRPRVEVQTPYGWVGLRDLSLGYQTMIAWVVDLASRMFEAYSDSENPLAEAAVVLVDEIDLHLHPQWQRRITGYLDQLFPNVQFIVTAHSPLVVQGAGVTNVAVLRRRGDQVEILNDPEEVRGWRVDQILTSDLFGLQSARPRDVEELIERQQQLVLLDAPSEAEQAELRQLDERLAALAPGETARDREAWALVHQLADELEGVVGGKP